MVFNGMIGRVSFKGKDSEVDRIVYSLHEYELFLKEWVHGHDFVHWKLGEYD